MLVIRRTVDQSIVFPTKRLYFCLLEYDERRAIIDLVSSDYRRERGLTYRNIYGEDTGYPPLFPEHPEILIGAEYVEHPIEDLTGKHVKFGIKAPREIGIEKGEELHSDFHPLTTYFQGDFLMINDEKYKIVKRFVSGKKREVYVAERID